MPDSFNTALLATRQDRDRVEREKLLAELDADITAQQPPVAGASSTAATPKKPAASPGVVSEGLKAIGGGVVDAVRETWNLIDDANTWLDQNFLDIRAGSELLGAAREVKSRFTGEDPAKASLQIPDLPDWAQNKSTGGQIGRSVTQFLVPFLGATKALKAAGMANTAVRGATAGAATDFAAFDPTEKRLSNLVMEFSDGNPAVGRPLFEYLASAPGDSHMEGRFKNTLEGLSLGMATEGLFKGAKAIKAHYTSKGQNPAQALQETAKAPAEDLTDLAVDTSKAPDMALAEQINLLTGVESKGPSKWQKRLDVKAASDAKPAEKPGLSLADGPLPTSRQDGSPDSFLNKGSTAPKLALEDRSGLPFEVSVKENGEVSFPDSWKLVEEDPAPRKLLLDTDSGELVMAKEAATETQLDLDTVVEGALTKTERSPAEVKALETYKELQEAVLAKVDDAAPVAKEADDIESRIERAQARVDSLLESGKDTTAAEKLLDSLTRKRDSGLRQAGSKLDKKILDVMADDPFADAIAQNRERLAKALNKQSGSITPSMLANMASMQAGAVTGYLSAEDDATFAERMSLAGIGALAGLGIKVGASKVLKSHERAVVDNPSPVAKELSKPHLQNIAPIHAPAKPQPVIRHGGVARIAQAVSEGNLSDVAKEAGDDAFNFARIDTEQDVEELFNATEAAFSKEIDQARGGAHVSFDQLKEMAEATGAGMKSLESLYQGTDGLASRFFAHRAMLVASGEKVVTLARIASEGSPEAILAANKQVKLHALIQAKVAGVQTEIARAMAAMRMTASSADFAANEVNSLIKSLGGHEAQMDFFKKLADIPTEQGRNLAVRMGSMAKTRSALVESITMAKLLSPVTHVANMTGNLLVAIGTIAEKAGASAIGTVLRSGDAIKAGEAKAQLFGMMGGLQDALGITMQGVSALKTSAGEAVRGNFGGAASIIRDNADEFGSAYKAGLVGAPVGRSSMHMSMDRNMETMGAIKASNFNLDPDQWFGKFVDAMGTLTRVPGHALAFGDEIFWTMQYRGELRAQAYRKAAGEGLEGDAAVSRIAELLDTPTPDMRGFAVKAAEEGTFTAPLGAFGRSTMAAVDKANFLSLPVGRMIVPFVKTPANILRYTFERTPLAVASAQVREELLAGGARRDMALSKIVAGSTLMTMAMVLQTGIDLNGTPIRIIGGGDLRGQAEALGGEQRYSLQVGDKFYSFSRLDPLGMFLGLGADLRDILGHVDEDTAGELAAAATLAISRNITSKSYLKGIGDLVDAFGKMAQGRDGELGRWFDNQVASSLPFNTAANAIRKEADPVSRKVWDMIDAVKNRTPGLSSELPPIRNAFGEEVMLKGGLGPDMMSPVMTSEVSSQPASREIARLNIDLMPPTRTLSPAPGAPTIDLDKWQYDKLSKMAGESFKHSVSQLIESDRYKDLTEGNPDFMDGKEKVIKRLYSSAKAQALKKLIAEDPALKQQWYDTRRKASSALSGQEPELPF